MIEYINGQLTELTPTTAVIEAAGVGYEINISLPTYSALLDKKEAKLYTEEIIREDTHQLFGFTDKGEREIFRRLTSVSGIGANTARMILSAYTAAELRQIIATGNARALGQVKGLGPKTAQRIIVDLKDKILTVEIGEGGLKAGQDMLFPTPNNAVKDEAVSALTMLGFSAAPSGKAVDKILKENPGAGVEQVIKAALKML
jgi:Holliday junction DNA helicase RuvA